MARKSKAHEGAEALEEVVQEVVRPEIEPGFIRIQIIKPATINKLGGMVKQGSIFDIPEDDFEQYENVAIELEE